MSGTQDLTRRIKSAKNIKQITKAMEMVSASKMRKAQAQALASRPYARRLEQTLRAIAALVSDGATHPLLKENEAGKDIILLVSTDKSLAGSLNTNLFRQTYQYLDNLEYDEPSFIIVGQKARAFALRTGLDLHAEFTGLPDPLSYSDSLTLSSMILKGYAEEEFRSVHVIYMDFITTLHQKPRGFKLLPLSTDWTQVIEEASQVLDAPIPDKSAYVFEPSAEAILNWLIPYYVELSIYQILLEARASEHSARMVSMKNASDNASEIIADLTLEYNKLRQQSITSELLDNVTASMIVR